MGLESKSAIEKRKTEAGLQFDAEDKSQTELGKDSEAGEAVARSHQEAGTIECHERNVRAAEQAEQAKQKEAKKLEGSQKVVSDGSKKVEGDLGKTAEVTKKNAESADTGSRKIKSGEIKKGVEAIAKQSHENSSFYKETEKQHTQLREASNRETAKNMVSIAGRKLGLGK